MLGRPRRNPQRVTTAIRFPPDLHARLQTAAEEREVSMNWLVNRACEHLLERLLPADEMKLRLTREDQP